MGKLKALFLSLLLSAIFTVNQPVAAQSLISRLFQKGGISTYFKQKKVKGYKRYYCGDMDAYNKQKAYRKHKKSRFRNMFSRRSRQKPDKKVVAHTKNTPKLTSSPPTATTGTKQPPAPSKAPPADKVPQQPVPVTQTPPVAEKSPDKPERPAPAPPLKESKPVLTRTELKKMTESQRRDTLRQMEPELELTPLQFLSDQDEFSVVNMDSFMKAMEYAQQGKIVLVEGHTDDLGRADYNLSLSMKRAEKIRELLLSGGISDELISVIGYGESKPLVPNTSDENRAINRRIEFKIFSLPE